MKNELPNINPIEQCFSSTPTKALGSANNNPIGSPSKVPQGTKIIGNYLLGKNIGEGTFGKVHLAMHIPTNQKVAIKIIEKSKMRAKDVIRVKSQISILKTIRHRHILNLYEIIQTQKSLLLVTQFLPNGELFKQIIKQKKIQQNQARIYFQQIIDAVQYLHRNRIAHRDLKPQNILIDYDKQIKIIDFGLSSDYGRKNQLKTFCGSPCYAAPEMVEAKASYKPLLVDIWSCGVVLFAMLCGHLPFCDADTHTLFKKVITCNYKIPNHVSPEARDLISSLIVLDPTKRLTLDEIKRHKWFNKFSPTASYGVNKGQQLLVDEALLVRLSEMGVDSEHTRQCLLRNQKNKDTATYFILMKKLIKSGEVVPSYMGNDNFNPKSILRPQSMQIDQLDTESYNDFISIETPDAPIIPQILQAPPSGWVKDKYDDEIRQLTEGQLMQFALSVLDALVFGNMKKQPVEIQPIFTQKFENPFKKMAFQKKANDFYQNNQSLAIKRFEIHEAQVLLKKNSSFHSERKAISRNGLNSLKKLRFPKQLRRLISKSQKQQFHSVMTKKGLQTNETLSPLFVENKKVPQNNNISKLSKKINIHLPNINRKLDHTIEEKIRDIHKRYKIYRGNIQ